MSAEKFAAGERAALAALCAADAEESSPRCRSACKSCGQGRWKCATRPPRTGTLAVLLRLARELPAQTVLEIGTGEGLTALALALACPALRITTIEADAAAPCRRLRTFCRVRRAGAGDGALCGRRRGR